MSFSLPPLSTLPRMPPKPVQELPTTLPSLEMLTGYRRNQPILSSSPARSSSPPRTPYASRYSQHQPHIQSSPPLDGGVELPPLRYRSDDPPSLWAKQDNQLPMSLKQASIRPISQPKHSYFEDYDLPPSSEFDIPDHTDDAEMSLPELDSETTSESTPGHTSSAFFSDTDDEEPSEEPYNNDDEAYGSEAPDTWRATFFRVSAERGRWRDDPGALKPTTTAGLRRLRMRQSMPTLSRGPSVGPAVTTRTISEPLVSTLACEASSSEDSPVSHDRGNQKGLGVKADEWDVRMEMEGGVVHDVREAFPVPSSMSPIPSMSPSDMEATPECDAESGHGFRDAYAYSYSSPLPPSSPPLSPMSGCILSLSRSVSPLSYLASSPALSMRDFDEDGLSGGDGDGVVPVDGVEHTDEGALGDRHGERECDATIDVTLNLETDGTVPSILHNTSALSSSLRTPSFSTEHPAPLLSASPTLDGPTEPLDAPSESDATANVTIGVESEIGRKHSLYPSERVPMSGPVVASSSATLNAQKTKTKQSSSSVRADDVRDHEEAEKENESVNAKAKAKKLKTKGVAKRKSDGAEGVEKRPVKKARMDSEPMHLQDRVVPQEKEKRVKARSKEQAGKEKQKARDGDEDVDMDVESSNAGASTSKSIALEDECEVSTSISTSKPKPPRKLSPSTKAKSVSNNEADDPSMPSTSTGASSAPKTKSKSESTTAKSNSKSVTGKSKSSSKSMTGKSKSKFAPDSPQKSTSFSPPEAIDEEMKGMLIEVLATSRASSLAVSVLTRGVLQAHPYLKEQRTEREWRMVVNRVLYAGMVPNGCGVFGKVDSSGKDDADRPLEAQWFYVPEHDSDQDRAMLLKSLMPRPAKRSETKKYKQYYWRPLDKISRWDKEDDL